MGFLIRLAALPWLRQSHLGVLFQSPPASAHPSWSQMSKAWRATQFPARSVYYPSGLCCIRGSTANVMTSETASRIRTRYFQWIFFMVVLLRLFPSLCPYAIVLPLLMFATVPVEQICPLNRFFKIADNMMTGSEPDLPVLLSLMIFDIKSEKSTQQRPP